MIQPSRCPLAPSLFFACGGAIAIQDGGVTSHGDFGAGRRGPKTAGIRRVFDVFFLFLCHGKNKTSPTNVATDGGNKGARKMIPEG